MANSSKRKQHKIRPTEYITIGLVDVGRREQLLANIASGYGKATQHGKNIKYVVGSPNIGLIEYTILDATLEPVASK